MLADLAKPRSTAGEDAQVNGRVSNAIWNSERFTVASMALKTCACCTRADCTLRYRHKQAWRLRPRLLKFETACDTLCGQCAF